MRFLVLVFVLIVLAATLPVIFLIGPQLDLSVLEEPSHPPAKNITPADPDAVRYFELKNRSCETLSKDFYIATRDISVAHIEGITSQSDVEEQAARSIADSFNYNESRRTYVKGDWMKISNSTATRIWKQGRYYFCTKNCTMTLLDEGLSNQYYDMLYELRTNCRYFAKTEFPSITDYIRIEKTGERTINGNRCDYFEITPGQFPQNLTQKQDQLVWGLSRLKGPIHECLDESTGIVVYRNLTLDLSDEYIFDVDEFTVSQETVLETFRRNVPDEFFAIQN